LLNTGSPPTLRSANITTPQPTKPTAADIKPRWVDFFMRSRGSNAKLTDDEERDKGAQHKTTT